MLPRPLPVIIVPSPHLLLPPPYPPKKNKNKEPGIRSLWNLFEKGHIKGCMRVNMK